VSVADLTLRNLGLDARSSSPTVIALSEDQIQVIGNRLIIDLAGRELADGVYELRIADSASDMAGNSLDGNADGVPGGPLVIAGNDANRLYKLTGDFNGDLGTSIFDFSTFAYWFGRPTTEAPDYVDLNGDGGVSIFDYAQFARSFNDRIVFPERPATEAISSAASRVSNELSCRSASPARTTDRRASDPAIDRVFQQVGREISWPIDPWQGCLDSERRINQQRHPELLTLEGELEEILQELVGG
jgi:hypothetical protein